MIQEPRVTHILAPQPGLMPAGWKRRRTIHNLQFFIQYPPLIFQHKNRAESVIRRIFTTHPRAGLRAAVQNGRNPSITG